MKVAYRFMAVLHIFIAVGALAGGSAAILNPWKPLGMSAEFLVNSPFKNYLIPGFILFFAVGIWNLLCAAGIIFKYEYSGYIIFISGCIMIFWIVVQCIMLNAIASLHVIFFFFGALQLAFSVAAMFDKMLIPANMAYYMYKCIRKSP